MARKVQEEDWVRVKKLDITLGGGWGGGGRSTGSGT